MTTREPTRWDDTRDDAPTQSGASYARQWIRTDAPTVIQVRKHLASLRRRVAKPVTSSNPDKHRRKVDSDNWDRSYARVLLAWLEQEHGIKEEPLPR